MVQLIISENVFCAGKEFKNLNIDILYKYLFKPEANLETIYNDMKRDINADSNLEIM